MAIRQNSNLPRVMVDTSVLISGSAWPRWPHEVLLAGLREEFQLVLCPYILQETRYVLQNRFARHVSRFDELIAQTDFELVADPAQEEIEQNKNLVRDIMDVPIALTAINAKVDYLVSQDKDLTARDETTAALRKQVKVMIAGTFLREVLGWTSEELEAIRHRKWSDLDT
jgi:putative PIN family toxin of toxin-antitoxin system